jgi:hypothetical protein
MIQNAQQSGSPGKAPGSAGNKALSAIDNPEQQFAPKVTEFPLENVRRNVLRVPYAFDKEPLFIFKDEEACQTQKIPLSAIRDVADAEVIAILDEHQQGRKQIVEKRVYVDRYVCMCVEVGKSWRKRWKERL